MPKAVPATGIERPIVPTAVPQGEILAVVTKPASVPSDLLRPLRLCGERLAQSGRLACGRQAAL